MWQKAISAVSGGDSETSTIKTFTSAGSTQFRIYPSNEDTFMYFCQGSTAVFLCVHSPDMGNNMWEFDNPTSSSTAMSYSTRPLSDRFTKQSDGSYIINQVNGRRIVIMAKDSEIVS